jgi:hypothetical protein
VALSAANVGAAIGQHPRQADGVLVIKRHHPVVGISAAVMRTRAGHFAVGFAAIRARGAEAVANPPGVATGVLSSVSQLWVNPGASPLRSGDRSKPKIRPSILITACGWCPWLSLTLPISVSRDRREAPSFIGRASGLVSIREEELHAVDPVTGDGSLSGV